MSYFSQVNKVKYEGINSDNPLAYKFYNPEEKVNGQTMQKLMKFAVSYWHTFTADGSDPFGGATMLRPYNELTGLDLAKSRVEASFEFYEKLGVDYFCFHDVDIAPEGDTLSETFNNLDIIVEMIKDHMKSTNMKLLWNTANMFTNPRWVHGAATAPNADVYAHAAAKVKKSLEIGKELGSENFVFWGGREGYETLLNTDMKLELDNLGRFYKMALDYAKEINLEAQFLIEPKPKEPMKHQYDFDVATSLSFLQNYDLQNDFKFNIEANHATLAGHTFEHELHVARINGMLGSVDANQGDMLLGWDTDEFPSDIYSTTLAMYEILQNGGLGKGGLNFDAKVRRASFDTDDLFYSYITGMDSFAVGAKVAQKLIDDKVLENFVADRYSSYTDGIGLEIVNGTTNLRKLAEYAKNKEISNESGRQEQLKGILNKYILEAYANSK